MLFFVVSYGCFLSINATSTIPIMIIIRIIAIDTGTKYVSAIDAAAGVGVAVAWATTKEVSADDA